MRVPITITPSTQVRMKNQYEHREREREKEHNNRDGKFGRNMCNVYSINESTKIEASFFFFLLLTLEITTNFAERELTHILACTKFHEITIFIHSVLTPLALGCAHQISL